MFDQVVSSCGNPMMVESEDGCRWMVVFGSFFVQFIVCGITYTLGIFQVVFQDVFTEDHFDTSWAGAILLYTTALTSALLVMWL